MTTQLIFKIIVFFKISLIEMVFISYLIERACIYVPYISEKNKFPQIFLFHVLPFNSI